MKMNASKPACTPCASTTASLCGFSFREIGTGLGGGHGSQQTVCAAVKSATSNFQQTFSLNCELVPGGSKPVLHEVILPPFQFSGLARKGAFARIDTEMADWNLQSAWPCLRWIGKSAWLPLAVVWFHCRAGFNHWPPVTP